MSVDRVRDAYAARAAEYTELFGSIEAAAEHDREHLLGWALGIDGRIIDVGCGPGQWTHFLAEHGVNIEGVDLVPEFIDTARTLHPGVSYRVGRADRLGVEDAVLGGVLSWFSLIHTDPEEIDAPLAEFARCVRPGGGLALGFFEGPELVPFDHAVTTGWFWPVDQLCLRIEQAGFQVTDAQTRDMPVSRRLGVITARRSGRGRTSAIESTEELTVAELGES
ncbi:MAG: class I SAM-dependent methyltransferase [Micropruina sp.]|uniref:class I SAM-dependent methyltransferase n=1 Tax=Micropruina sp. TaxID=2737536 RepID=UPI0039E67958